MVIADKEMLVQQGRNTVASDLLLQHPIFVDYPIIYLAQLNGCQSKYLPVALCQIEMFEGLNYHIGITIEPLFSY